MSRVFVLLLLFLVGFTRALVCESEAAAFEAVYQGLLHAPFARHVMRAYSAPVLRDLLVQRLHLIQSVETHDLALQSTSKADDNAFSYFLADTWRADMDYVLFSSSQVDTNCTLLAANAATELPPVAIRDVITALVLNELLVADQTPCAENEVTTWDPVDHVYMCQCAEGYVCSATTNDELLAITTTSALTVAIALLLVGSMVMIGYTMIRWRRVERAGLLEDQDL